MKKYLITSSLINIPLSGATLYFFLQYLMKNANSETIVPEMIISCLIILLDVVINYLILHLIDKDKKIKWMYSLVPSTLFFIFYFIMFTIVIFV